MELSARYLAFSKQNDHELTGTKIPPVNPKLKAIPMPARRSASKIASADIDPSIMPIGAPVKHIHALRANVTEDENRRFSQLECGHRTQN